MPVFFLIAVLFLLGAVLLRLVGQMPGIVLAILKIGIPCLGLALWGMGISGEALLMPGSIWLDDGVSRTVAGIACLTLLLLGLVEISPVAMAAVYWSAGLMSLCAVVRLPAVQWIALLLSAVPILFYGRISAGTRPGLLTRHPALLLGSGLFTIGFWVLMGVENGHPAATISIILLLCGLGGMLGWFPFPRVRSLSGNEDSPAAIFSRRYLPCLTAGLVFLRMVERQPFDSYQMALLALAATFSLILCGARLLLEERLSYRFILSALSILSFLMFAVCLRNWEVQNAERAWMATSNLPSGQSLFASILACETIGLLVLACAFRLVHPQTEEPDYTQTLSGAARGRPLFALSALGGLLSLAGVPPLPGLWWRLGLVSACLLPHRQSNVTQAMEADHSFALLALLLVGLLILNSIGHLQLFQRMLFEEAFRVREESAFRSVRFAAALGILLLLLVMCVPLSVGPFLAGNVPAGGEAVSSISR